MAKRVLIFAPHGSYQVHHQLDAVIGTSLRLRGCDVVVVTCDQLFSECYVAGRPFDAATCAACASSGAELYRAFGFPITPLSSLLTESDRRETAAWAASIELEQFQHAQFEGLPVGTWMSYGMFARFRTSRLNFDDPEIARVAPKVLQNGAMLVRALRLLLSQYRPDHALTYQGGHSYYRVFYEMMRARNIPVLCHERGYTDNSFLLLSNRTNYEMNNKSVPEWENWRDTPLTRSELEQMDQLLVARESGKNMNFVQFSGWTTEASSLRETLRIPRDKPILALFGSGDWEVGMYRGYGPLKMAYQTQLEWIAHTAEIARRHGMYLVIRHHPLGGGTETYPRADEFMGELVRFNRSLGDHVRVVMPYEKISSYDLMWHAEAVVSLFSTTSVEAVVRGVGGISTCQSVYQPAGVQLVESSKTYEESIIRAVRATGESSIETLRTAFRFMHFIYFVAFCQRFRSVGIKNVYERDIRVTDSSQLLPGADPALDRVCDHILTGSPLYALPDQNRSLTEETKYLEEVKERNARQRASSRAAVATSEVSQSEVAVLPLTTVGERTLSRDFVDSSARIRHPFAQLALIAAVRGLPLSLGLHQIRDIVAQLITPQVWAVSDALTFDESFLSAASDALLKEPERIAAVGGIYQINGRGWVRDELNTKLAKPMNFAADCKRMSEIGDPLFLLSITLWRREALLAWLDSAIRNSWSSEECARDLYDLLVLSERAIRLGSPLIYQSENGEIRGSASLNVLQ